MTVLCSREVGVDFSCNFADVLYLYALIDAPRVSACKARLAEVVLPVSNRRNGRDPLF